MPEVNQTAEAKTSRPMDVNSLMAKIVELQNQLLQAQEKNLLLSAQTRELERQARDAADLKSELAAQAVLLSDKSRENKHLHQELSRIASTLDIKLNEATELAGAVNDVQQQLKRCEAERDHLAVLLTELESVHRKAEEFIRQVR